MAALWRRIAELHKSDADIALRYAVAWRFRGLCQPQSHIVLGKRIFTQMSAEYPFDLATKRIIARHNHCRLHERSRQVFILYMYLLVGRAGLEPATKGL